MQCASHRTSSSAGQIGESASECGRVEGRFRRHLNKFLPAHSKAHGVATMSQFELLGSYGGEILSWTVVSQVDWKIALFWTPR